MRGIEGLIALFLFILLGVVVIRNSADVAKLVQSGGYFFSSIAGSITGNSSGLQPLSGP